MANIKPYNPNQKGGSGETMIAVLIIGALAYFGYQAYQKNKEKIDALKKVV
jgi:predicted negative regulator of RcsB-dependent stress response